MRSTNRRIVRNLICLTALFVCASVPLAAQRGIDLLDAEQVLRGGASDGTVTLRAVAAEAPTGVVQATHERDTIRYDDGEFENFMEGGGSLPPFSNGGMVEWAQRFEVEADSVVVSARACFLRPEGDLNRSLDFSLRFYDNDPVNRVDHPGRQSGFRYTVEEDIRRVGDDRCVLLRGDLVGKTLNKGKHWIGIEWNTATQKRLGGDHYTADDMAKSDRTNMAEHETEVRHRPVVDHPEDAPIDGWLDPRNRDRTQLTSGLKAIGVSLVVERTHAVEPDPPPPTPPPTPPTPDPTVPEPDPDPGTITEPPAGAGYTDCRPTVAPLTFEDGVKVSLCFETQTEKTDAKAVYRSDNSGLLYFFDENNAEVFVKVLDGCDRNGHRWLYVAALTDVAFNLYINDGRNPPKAYHNPSGDNHELVQDLMAFRCLP